MQLVEQLSLTPTIKPQSIDIVVTNYNYLMHTIDKNANVMFMNLKKQQHCIEYTKAQVFYAKLY
jgi:hypothetical protein